VYNIYKLVDKGVSRGRAAAEPGVMGITHEHQSPSVGREKYSVYPLPIPQFSG